MDLNQVTVSVTNIDKAVEFYETMGLELIVKTDDYARFIVKGNKATFSIHKKDFYHPNETLVYFETEDVDKTVDEIKSKGVKIFEKPKMQSWLWYEAYLEDPDGNKICIYHAGENRLNPPWRIKK